MSGKASGLGKGLGAIFMENGVEDNKSPTYLKLSELEPNRDQPRKEFDTDSLAELAESVSRHGILQPLLVRPIDSLGYQIVAGERRWRAARMAGLKEVPVVIKDLSDEQVMEIALIENLQREDLTPIEEAKGYKSLMETYSLTHEEVAKAVGKSRAVITNAVRLLTLPQEVIDLISEGKISAGHARALLSLKDENNILKVAKMVIEKALSVRETESMCKRLNEACKEDKVSNKKKLPPIYNEIELSLRSFMGRKVQILNSGKKKGVLQIEFYNEEDLLELAGWLGRD